MLSVKQNGNCGIDKQKRHYRIERIEEYLVFEICGKSGAYEGPESN